MTRLFHLLIACLFSLIIHYGLITQFTVVYRKPVASFKPEFGFLGSILTYDDVNLNRPHLKAKVDLKINERAFLTKHKTETQTDLNKPRVDKEHLKVSKMQPKTLFPLPEIKKTKTAIDFEKLGIRKEAEPYQPLRLYQK